MEEILASIRRIIADDQETLQPSEPEMAPPSPLRNVLDIAELHVSPLLGANEPVLGPWSREDEAFQDHLSELAPPEDTYGIEEPEAAAHAFVSKPAVKISTPAAPSQPASAETLLSNDATAAVSGAFERLGASMQPSQPQTVEDLMKEMLRPMLKSWLDDHLPSLVERLVRAEIERVARGRG